ncbi:Flagellar biosynthetic protein FliU [Paenibacillus sp. P1XP2]|nr:Flagellar biosynthetic protein FliU [Paenibacillus sp. P1XP2]
MTKQKVMLVPGYMNQFSCIGSACEDTCCSGWQVSIDQETYKKYNKVRSDLRPMLDKHVKRNRAGKSAENYAKIILNEDCSCPMLNEEKLCSIQLKLGEEHLSNTCSTYPRIANRVNGILEKSATLSCPEAARLALLNPNGIEFDETLEELNTRNVVKSEIWTTSGQAGSKLSAYFWELRIFTIQVLQTRTYSLADRLIILGLFYQKVEQYIEAENINDIPQLIASYTNMITKGDLENILSGIPALSTIQMELLKQLADIRAIRGIASQRYLDCFKQFLAGIQYDKESTIEEISERYQYAYQTFYQPFMTQHEYILENYLVNYVFNRLFPLAGGTDVFEEYIMLVIHYSMIKMHLIGMAGFHKGNFAVEHVIQLIQSFSKTIEHNSQYVKDVRELLRKNGFTTMAYMSILIKNN